MAETDRAAHRGPQHFANPIFGETAVLEQRWPYGLTSEAPLGFILTNAEGKIVYANDAAGKMLDGCVLLCADDELSARDSICNAALRRAIQDAAGSPIASRPLPTTSLVVTGPGSPPLFVRIVPVRQQVRHVLHKSTSAFVAIFACALAAVEYA